MNKQVGFIQWDIHKNTIGDDDVVKHTDIVYWEKREAAQAAKQ